jgi:hypothetical protein
MNGFSCVKVHSGGCWTSNPLGEAKSLQGIYLVL